MNTDALWPEPSTSLVAGTGDPDQAAPMGNRRPRTVGSVTSTTSSLIRPSSLWHGTGSGATGAARSAGVDGQSAYYVDHRAGREAFSTTCEPT